MKKNSKDNKKRAEKPKRSKAKLYVIVSCIVLAVALVCALILYAFVYGGHVVVMYVDGFPITRNELSFHMSMEKQNVSNYFFLHHNANLNRDSWTRQYGGQRPDAVLRERAAERAAEAKTLQILALEHGISDDISYKAMQRERRELNRERRAAFEAGEVLYGVVEFVPMTHYLQVMSNFRVKVHEILSDSVVVEDRQLREMYERYYDVYNHDYNISIAELFIPYILPGRETEGRQQRDFDQARDSIWEIYRRLTDGEDFYTLSEEFTGEPPFEGTLGAGGGHGRSVGSLALLTDMALELSVGEFSQPFENGFGFSIVKLLDSGVEVTMSFEEAVEFLFPIALENNIDDFLRKRTENAQVVINEFVFITVGVP